MIAVSPDRYRTLSLTAAGREAMCGRSDDLKITRPQRHPNRAAWRTLRTQRRAWHRWSRVGDDWLAADFMRDDEDDAD